MKDDLTKFEKDMLRSINIVNNTNYKHFNFMEWSTDKKHVEGNMKDGEILYTTLGVHVAINPNKTK